MKKLLLVTLLMVFCQLVAPAAFADIDELLRPYESGDKEFERLEIGKMIVFWHQRMIGDAIVEKDQIVYQFDKATEELLAIKTQWRDDLTDVKTAIISEEEADAIAGGEPLFSTLYIISPESDVFKLDPVPQNPCWMVRTVIDDATRAVIIDAVTGEFLGYGIPPPTESYSFSGPQAPCAYYWSHYRGAATWFDRMGYSCDKEQWPSRASIQSYIQNYYIGMFYEIAHGGSYYFESGCSNGQYERTYASDIESWIADYPEMRFAFIASCEGLCDTGPGSFSYAFRKGLNVNTVTVGYCGMGESFCDNCWSVSSPWQNALFDYMIQGWTVKDAFDQALADYPACAEPNNCMRFAGDENFGGPYHRFIGPVPTGAITGTVTDSSGPVTGVQIYADDGFGHTASDSTTGNGTYSITVPISDYNLSFYHPLYRDSVIFDITVTDNDTTIVDVTIVPAQGACCVDEVCAVTNTGQGCNILGGVWFKYEECPDVGGSFECPPEGACCISEVCVATLIESACDSLNGHWYPGEECPDVGGSFVCPPEGACCINSVCSMTTSESACDSLNGDWYPGEECPDVGGSFGCPGACCIYGLCAATISESACDSLNGDWYPGEKCPDMGGSFGCPVGCNEDSIKIEIFTDNYPEETSWELREQITQTVIASYGPLENSSTLHSWTVCVDSDSCYDWIINDSYGDGICCNHGIGYFSIFFNGVLADSGGEFGPSCTTAHMGNGCSEFITFEANNGDLVGTNDWEWGTPSNVGPPSAYSGTNCWGTIIDGNRTSGYYEPAGFIYSDLTFKLDLGMDNNATIEFYEWYQTSSVTFDSLNVIINAGAGDVLLSAKCGTTPDWQPAVYDLSAYTGIAEMKLQYFSRSSLDKPGWYIDDLTITSCVRVAPEIDVTPLAISGDANPGYPDADTLTIYNSGDCALNYTITTHQDPTVARFDGTVEPLYEVGDGNTPGRTPIRYLPISDKQIDDNINASENLQGEPLFPPQINAFGGPDAFGYTWIDSDEPSGPAYNWIDISTIGTEITVWNGNADTGYTDLISMGMTFDFYGGSYDSIVVSTNGWVSFSAQTSSYLTNRPIPSFTSPNNLLAVIWDYHMGGTIGHCYYYYDMMENQFIVSWVNWPWRPYPTDPHDFQVVLDGDDGTILYQYGTGVYQPEWTGVTVGIENDAGSIGLEVVYNAAYIEESLAVQFVPPTFWLISDVASGTIPPDGFFDYVEVTMDALELTDGTYTGRVEIMSNDPDETVIDIPVTFVVGGTGTIAGTVTDSSGPVSGVQVYADDGFGHTGSDSTIGDGSYSMTVATSIYDLLFSHPTHRDTVISNVTVTLDDTTIVDVIMEEIEVQIPTLSEWGMLILALLLLAAGTIALIRRRKATIFIDP